MTRQAQHQAHRVLRDGVCIDMRRIDDRDASPGCRIEIDGIEGYSVTSDHLEARSLAQKAFGYAHESHDNCIGILEIFIGIRAALSPWSPDLAASLEQIEPNVSDGFG